MYLGIEKVPECSCSYVRVDLNFANGKNAIGPSRV